MPKITRRYSLAGAGSALSGLRAGWRSGANLYRNFKKVKTQFRGRRKGPGSKTRTKKRKRPEGDWDRDGNGVAYKKVTITYKKNKQFKARELIGEPGSFQQIYYNGNVNLMGLQKGTLVGGATTVELNNLFETLNGVPAPVNFRSRRFNFTYIRWEVEFMNCGPAPMEVDIYHLIDKNTSVTAPGAVITEWEQGLQDEAGGFTTTTPETPWSKPTEVKRHNLLYWTKRYPKSLAAGEKIKFTLQMNVNRVVDFEHIQRFNRVRGITNSIFVVQRGTVCDGERGMGFVFPPPSGGVTLCRTKLAWVATYKMGGVLLSDKTKKVRRIGALPTTITNLWTQNESAGAPQDTEDPLE